MSLRLREIVVVRALGPLENHTWGTPQPDSRVGAGDLVYSDENLDQDYCYYYCSCLADQRNGRHLHESCSMIGYCHASHLNVALATKWGPQTQEACELEKESVLLSSVNCGEMCCI